MHSFFSLKERTLISAFNVFRKMQLVFQADPPRLNTPCKKEREKKTKANMCAYGPNIKAFSVKLCTGASSEPGERQRGDDGHADSHSEGHRGGDGVGGILLTGRALELCKKVSETVGKAIGSKCKQTFPVNIRLWLVEAKIRSPER
jgi:hypothetical protein